jgi:hypothetical protein
MALAPFFGWVGAVYLRSRAELEALAREKVSRAMTRQNSRLSRMAAGAFAAGAVYQLWPVFVSEPGIPGCRGMTPEISQNLETFLAMALPLTATALLLGLVANFRINRSCGSLRGHWLAQLAVLLSVLNVLSTLALPRFFLWREIGAETLALRTLHYAQARYRSRYPETGYSPDLGSLGPPPSTEPRSVEHAGLLDGPLFEGVYCAGKDPLAYEPRTGDDGTIVAYVVRLEVYGGTRLMDESGSIRSLLDPLE